MNLTIETDLIDARQAPAWPANKFRKIADAARFRQPPLSLNMTVGIAQRLTGRCMGK